MIISAASRDNSPRLAIVRVGIALGLLFLLVNLFHVQIMDRDRYGDLSLIHISEPTRPY